MMGSGNVTRQSKEERLRGQLKGPDSDLFKATGARLVVVIDVSRECFVQLDQVLVRDA